MFSRLSTPALLVLALNVAFSSGQNSIDNWEYDNPNQCYRSGQVPCSSKVSVTCTVTKDDGGYVGVGSDCMNTIKGQDEVPIYEGQGAFGTTCGVKEIDVRIEYKLCNENRNDDIILNAALTNAQYENVDVEFSFAPIKPMTCRTVTLDRTWDLCTVSDNLGRRRRIFEVTLNGRVDKPGNDNFCYCYTYRRSTHMYNTRIAPPPTMAPTAGKGKGKGKHKHHWGGRALRRSRTKSNENE